MVASNFEPSLKRVLVHEGGYSNHPADPGGVTLEGVIQRVYDGWRRKQGLKSRPLTAAMRKEAVWQKERNAIYRAQYWDASRCDELPIGVDYCVFDGSVNSGPVQSGKWLQRALKKAGVYKGGVDGHIGAGTVDAANKHPDHDQLVADICAERMAMLRSLRTWSTFGTGWTRRVNDVKKGGQAWAAGRTAPKPAKLDAEATAKADERDTKIAETPAGEAAKETTQQLGGGGLFGLIVGYWDTASNWLSAFSGLPEWLTRWILGAIAALALMAFVVAVGRVLYGLVGTWLEKRRQEKERAALASFVDHGASPVTEPRPKRRRGSKGSKAGAALEATT